MQVTLTVILECLQASSLSSSKGADSDSVHSEGFLLGGGVLEPVCVFLSFFRLTCCSLYTKISRFAFIYCQVAFENSYLVILFLFGVASWSTCFTITGGVNE